MLGEYKNNKARIPEGIQKLKSEKNIYLYLQSYSFITFIK